MYKQANLFTITGPALSEAKRFCNKEGERGSTLDLLTLTADCTKGRKKLLILNYFYFLFIFNLLLSERFVIQVVNPLRVFDIFFILASNKK